MNAPAHSAINDPAERVRLDDLLREVPAVLRGCFARVGRKRWTNDYLRFRKDPYFFLRYYSINLIVLAGAAISGGLMLGHISSLNYVILWLAGLILFVLPSYSLIFLSGLYYFVLCLLVQQDVFTLTNAALIPAGLVAGTVSAAVMHNAAHENFRSRWLNRLWGELCGLFQLSGFAGWTVSHFMHHAAPDNPDKDAHAPGDMTFSQYVNAMGHMMKRSITEGYFKAFGVGKHSTATWGLVTCLLPLVRYVRILFILTLFGPAAFVFLYVPFKIANTMIYGDFNYRTHRPHPDGGFEVLNLNHNVWFKMLNAISIGSYYHKNHHRNPKVFNPGDVVDDGRPFITFSR